MALSSLQAVASFRRARAWRAHAEYARKIRVVAEHRISVLAVFSRRFRMIMDLASALLSPQNRRLFKFHKSDRSHVVL